MAITTRAETKLRDRLKRLLEAVERMEADPDYPVPPHGKVVMGDRHFRTIGRRFLEHFVTFGGLEPDTDVLDVGCGSGRMALPLTYYLTGSYVGFDVHAPSVQWCEQVIDHPYFRFELVDLHNDFYNPASSNDAASFRFPYDDESFDFLIATSVFTHMLRPEVANYLREFARVLRADGVAFVTTFLLNPASITAMTNGTSVRRFPHACGDALVKNPQRPREAVALHEAWFRADARAAGLNVDRVAYGAWTGQERLTGQDVALLRKN